MRWLLLPTVFASLSKEYEENPSSFYRDPCPDSRKGLENACTPFDEYVWRKDGVFSYELVGTNKDYRGVTGYGYKMYSQKWLNATFWNHNVEPGQSWFHYVTVWIPDKLRADLAHSAMLNIRGGSNTASGPGYSNLENNLLRVIAQTTGSVTAVIEQVPNGPISFTTDWRESRKPDEVDEHTWRAFILNPEVPEQLAWFPMVKAALRTMDMVEEIIEEKFGDKIEKWAVSGASKRGWAAWLTAAADQERVKLLVPVVCQFLNIYKTMKAWYRSFGGTPLVQANYWLEEIPKFIEEPHFALYSDPMMYKERLTMPKLIIVGVNDYFWPADDSRHYFDQLPGANYMRVLPNAEHSLAFSGVSTEHFLFSIRSLYLMVMLDIPLPTMKMRKFDDPAGETGGIEIQTSEPPVKIFGLIGDSQSKLRRDFRIIGARNNTQWTDQDQNLKLPIPNHPDQPKEFIFGLRLGLRAFCYTLLYLI